MAANDLSLFQKFITTLFLIGWMVWTGGIWLEITQTSRFLLVIYGLASALGFSIIGSMHGIKMDELREMARVNISLGPGDNE